MRYPALGPPCLPFELRLACSSRRHGRVPSRAQARRHRPGWAGPGAVGTVVGSLALCAWSILRHRGKGTGVRRAPRTGRAVYIHGLASSRPGDGAWLLWSIVEEADANGWALALDASNESLAGYYARFGFRPEEPGPGATIRMVRTACGVLACGATKVRALGEKEA
jgi:hypothetical protein